MQIKSILILLIIGAVYLNESEAHPKLGLIKAKVALAKAPHVIAHVAVAKEVKAKTKIAAVKALDAAKAAKVAAFSAFTAPFRAAKKTFALKLGALKAVKALKLAKVAKVATIVKNLKKGPIILPVPVALPIVKPVPVIKALPSLPTLPSLPSLPQLPQLPQLPNLFNLPPPSLGDSLGPIQGIISGAQKAIQSAGSAVPFLSSLTSSFGVPEAKVVKEAAAVTPAPVYRFVPEVGFTNYNKVSYQPQIEVEVPSVEVPSAVYGPPVIPAKTYGVPN